MKIAMVDPSLFTGRYDDGLCAALARAGHDVTLLGRPTRATDAIEPVGYRYVPRFFRLGERLRGLLGEGRAGQAAKGAGYAFDAAFGSLSALEGDVVHFQWLPLARVDAMWLRRLEGRAALVHTVHNATPFHGSAAAQGRGYHGLLARFDALIVHGEPTRATLVAGGIDPARIHLVPHPPMQLATASAADRAAVPPPAPGMPRILFFGTVRPYKGLDLLIDAALALWREGLAFELAIAGKPFMDMAPLLEPVRAAGFGDRLVSDLGFLPEGRLDAHLSAADIVAFPYRAIDSSGAFLSALRYGAAMITSDAGMFGELNAPRITQFPTGDAAGLRDGLRTLIRDGAARRRGGEGALALLRALPDWDEAARGTLAAYRAALARGGAA